MSLLRKVRTLLGALVHKPFMPRPEKVDLDEGQDDRGEGRPHPELEARELEVGDTARVADLIAEQQREEQG
jgi:hypothetical protein